MTPLDDELRRALSGQAGKLPAGVDPMAGIEERAHAIRRRRNTLAIGGSALAVALIVAVPVAVNASRTSTPSPFVSAPPSVAPTPLVSDSSPPESPPPPPPPVSTPAPTAAPVGWGFRGSQALASQLSPAATSAFTALRRQAGDPGATGYAFQPLWAGSTPSGGYDALMFLATQHGRVPHVVTYKSSPGGSGIVADQPVGPATAYADAILPGDPTNFILVVGPPGPRTTVTYIFSAGPQTEAVTDGVALFGRGAEARGDGSPDYLAVNTAAGAGIKAMINTHTVDTAIPGRLSTPDGAADWVYQSLLADDRQTADEHLHLLDGPSPTTLTSAQLGEAGTPTGCALGGGPGGYACTYLRPDASRVTLTVRGGASAGYSVIQVQVGATGTP